MIRLPIIDRLPFVGPLINGVLDGTTPLGPGPTPVPAAVEKKVAATTVAATVVSLAMTLLMPWLGKLPSPLRGIVMALLPPLVTAVVGYLAPHTARTAVPPKE